MNSYGLFVDYCVRSFAGKMSNNDQKDVSRIDEISSRIDQKLGEISSNNNNTNNYQFIFRIDNILRMTYEAAYEPEMVSIGPYHRGKNNLQKMEKYKLQYLQGILKRQNQTSTCKYIDSLLQDEEKARNYYAEHVPLTKEEFLEMMLLDGCFIVEFLRKYANQSHRHDQDQDPIFKMEWISEIIRRDLLLFENQIPFFILVKLFDMTKISNNHDQEQEEEASLISLAVSCLNDAISQPEKSSSSSYIISQPENVFHLLSLMYESWCSSFAKSFNDEDDDDQEIIQDNTQNRPPEFSCISFGRKNQEKEKEEDDFDDIMFIKSVTELKQDGIKFVKSEKSTSWLDIKFEDGEIKIPPLVIQDGTESILRNLIAYEQYMFDLGYSGKFVTDYATFMDCLINTPVDAQKLRVKGIIKNWLGNDEEVTDMFNNICNNVFLSPPDFTYRKHFKNVNEHSKERRNPWINDLKKTYFKNPWSIISLVAATLLLILTLVETVLSFLQHFKKDVKVICTCK